jgi:DNA-binding FrmR family transcriptional regulator
MTTLGGAVNDDRQTRDDVIKRLRRVQGQIGGLVAMVEDGRRCDEVVTQLAAAAKALDRVGFKIVASGLQDCSTAEQAGTEPEVSREQLEKLFLSLA